MYKSLEKKILLLFICFSFLAVTIFLTYGTVFNFLFLFTSFVFAKKITLDKYDMKILLLFYLQPFLFFIGTGILCFILDVSYINFSTNIVGRLINYFMYMTLYICISSYNKRNIIECSEIINAYRIGLFILLFFGIWQILNMVLGVPYPNFETRNKIHSMDLGALSVFFKNRVTSLAREPAYLIPYMIDLFIIIYYSCRPRKKKILLLTLVSIIIFFTLSLSGYINFFIIIFFIVLYDKNKKRKFYTIFLLSLVLLILLLQLGDLFFSILGRLNPKDFQSTRLQEAYLPLVYMFKNFNIFTFLFGYGPKGMQYIGTFLEYTGKFKGMSYPFEGGTSHVILVDFFVDYGLVGFFMCISLFCLLYKFAKTVYKKMNTRFLYVLLINLIINCLYTSDYASPRFTVILLIFISLYRVSKKTE